MARADSLLGSNGLVPNGSTQYTNGVTTEVPRQRENPPVLAGETRASHSTSRTVNPYDPQGPYSEFAWVLEWVPSYASGLVKIPANRLGFGNRSQDILAAKSPSLLENNQNPFFLPMSSSRLVLLKDFALARKNITSTVITQGSRYYQVFTETFPEFSMTIESVIFGDRSDRVLAFFDYVTKFLTNPAKYSGSLYLYDVFSNDPMIIEQVYNTPYNLATKRYKLIPKAYSKTRSREDNTVVNVQVSGIVVEIFEPRSRSDLSSAYQAFRTGERNPER